MADDEQVRLIINGEEITKIYKTYDIECSMFEQPAGFTITLGDDRAASELLHRYAINDTFELWIGDNQIQSGQIDCPKSSGNPTSVTFQGRDWIKAPYDEHIEVERAFQNESYLDLTRIVLDICGQKDRQILTDNDKARKNFSGIDPKKFKLTRHPGTLRLPKVVELPLRKVGKKLGAEASLAEAILGGALDVTNEKLSEISGYTTRDVVRQLVKAKIGGTWWSFLQHEYAKVGLFLWCSPDGNFVLSEPNPNQEPAYRLLRRRNETRNTVNVIDANFQAGGAGQHGRAVCYGRCGGRKSGRAKVRGEYRDELRIAAGMDRVIVFEDSNVQSDEDAMYQARRRIVEERRRAFKLEYTVAGHRVLSTQGRTRAVWTMDTMAHVVDDEFGLDAPYYLGSVKFSRKPQTSTTLSFMRPEDLVFSETMQP